jgi:WXXGXW repeat (2 copies)
LKISTEQQEACLPITFLRRFLALKEECDLVGFEKEALMKNLIPKILVAIAPLLFAGCEVYENPGHHTVYRPAPAVVHHEVVVVQPSAPPPMKVEVMPPRPNNGFVWVGGNWEWQNGGWVWKPGRWVPPPKRGAVWAPGHWEGHGHNKVWVEGGWR